MEVRQHIWLYLLTSLLPYFYTNVMRILYVSGASAGHLAPLVAVERAVKAEHRDAESLFLCSDRSDDAAYLRHERVTFKQIPLPRRSAMMPWMMFKNYRMSGKILDEFKPDAVFSKGGAVSVPACYAAYRRKIPIVLHESDAVMGRANSLVAKWAKHVCLGFPLSDKNNSPSTFTGNPVRSSVITGNREEGLRITKLSGRRPVLMILGGSQGAEALNAAVRTHTDALLETCDIIHLTGKGKRGSHAREGYWSTEFAYEELPHLYALATLALCRAGAGTISELAANAIPAILVPIEGLANDHQVKNAEIAAGHGGCIVLKQEKLNEDLVRTMGSLITDHESLKKMSQKISTFQQSDAALRIAKILVKSIAREPLND
jgi:UDP-N-acetylglucosamine--N-acetylmuramyl-(pentapeptide) pyrophosphoryl-undecaprenol N-acetylglucosamine transferase